MKCIVKGCENHKNEGGFEDGMCLPCYLFITTGEGVYSQAYRNAKPAELTDEEIHQAIRRGFARDGFLSDGIFLEIKELLRKAQEK